MPMHLSTGGSPQWLYELIKESMLQNEVFVAEFNNYGSFDIQKNEIINLIGKKNHECVGPCFSDNWKEERLYKNLSLMSYTLTRFLKTLNITVSLKSYWKKFIRKIGLTKYWKLVILIVLTLVRKSIIRTVTYVYPNIIHLK